MTGFDTKIMYPSSYLKADDLDKDYTLTISSVTQEELTMVGGVKKVAFLVYFEETKWSADANQTEEKRLVLNKTNTMSIKKHHGRFTKDWTGKKITLYATTCKVKGKQTDCIRVR